MTAGAAVTAAAASPPPPPELTDRQPHRQGQGQQQEQAGQVHRGSPTAVPIRRTTSAASQAMTHWPTTTPTAHLSPSSRLMAAMAATQGV